MTKIHCIATKNNGKNCKQTTNLVDGYCKYHQSPKFMTKSTNFLATNVKKCDGCNNTYPKHTLLKALENGDKSGYICANNTTCARIYHQATSKQTKDIYSKYKDYSYLFVDGFDGFWRQFNKLSYNKQSRVINNNWHDFIPCMEYYEGRISAILFVIDESKHLKFFQDCAHGNTGETVRELIHGKSIYQKYMYLFADSDDDTISDFSDDSQNDSTIDSDSD